ncbi:hypothetical protein LB505_011673 [Fusarium chuoi]|nr:hypothetical protein LB505_011673 [Fusarium chuoi]
MAARILNGFFSTVSQGGGLMFIFDMFFFHERARKINIWAAFIILSPYMGPLLTAFIITTEPWPIAFWVYFTEAMLNINLATFVTASAKPVCAQFASSSNQLSSSLAFTTY